MEPCSLRDRFSIGRVRRRRRGSGCHTVGVVGPIRKSPRRYRHTIPRFFRRFGRGILTTPRMAYLSSATPFIVTTSVPAYQKSRRECVTSSRTLGSHSHTPSLAFTGSEPSTAGRSTDVRRGRSPFDPLRSRRAIPVPIGRGTLSHQSGPCRRFGSTATTTVIDPSERPGDHSNRNTKFDDGLYQKAPCTVPRRSRRGTDENEVTNDKRRCIVRSHGYKVRCHFGLEIRTVESDAPREW